MSELYKVSSNPHIRSKVTTNGLMLAVSEFTISDSGHFW